MRKHLLIFKWRNAAATLNVIRRLPTRGLLAAALWLFCALKALHLHGNGRSVCANSSSNTNNNSIIQHN